MHILEDTSTYEKLVIKKRNITSFITAKPNSYESRVGIHLAHELSVQIYDT